MKLKIRDGNSVLSYTDDSVRDSQINGINTNILAMQNEYGAKNLLQSYGDTQESDGVTFTKHSDGTYILSGTATGSPSAFAILDTSRGDIIDFDKAKKYIISCGVTGGTIGLGFFLFSGGSFITEFSTRTGGIGTVEIDASAYSYDRIIVYIEVSNGTACNNVVIKPMIRDARISDDTYVPYAKTNKQLTDDVAANTSAIEVIENVTGAKNLNSYPYLAIKEGSDVFTVNGDGSITANGPVTSEYAAIYLHSRTDNANALHLKSGKYILNGCPAGGNGQWYQLISYNDGTNTYESVDYGVGGIDITITHDANHTDTAQVTVAIVALQGATFNNLTFYPMIRPAGTDPTWVPYAMSNRELTERVKIEKKDSITTDNNGNYYLGSLISLNGYVPVSAVSEIYNDDIVIFTPFFANDYWYMKISDGSLNSLKSVTIENVVFTFVKL